MKWYKVGAPAIGLAILLAGVAFNRPVADSTERKISYSIPIGWNAIPVSLVKDDSFLTAWRIAATRTIDRSNSVKWAYSQPDFCKVYEKTNATEPNFNIAVSKDPEIVASWLEIRLNDRNTTISDICGNDILLNQNSFKTAVITDERSVYDQLVSVGIKPMAIAIVPDR
jgi:hypothetical protein